MYYDIPEGLGLRKEAGIGHAALAVGRAIASPARAAITRMTGAGARRGYSQFADKARTVVGNGLRYINKRYDAMPALIKNPITHAIGLALGSSAAELARNNGAVAPLLQVTENKPQPFTKGTPELRRQMRELQNAPKATTLGQLGNVRALGDLASGWRGIVDRPLDFGDAQGTLRNAARRHTISSPFINQAKQTIEQLPNVTYNDIYNSYKGR